jgi:hypothetical protein
LINSNGISSFCFQEARIYKKCGSILNNDFTDERSDRAGIPELRSFGGHIDIHLVQLMDDSVLFDSDICLRRPELFGNLS